MRSFAEGRFVSRILAAVLATAVWTAVPLPANARPASAKQLYTSALARERTLRDADARPTLEQLRALGAAYERVVHRYPRSGYSDNAIWQAAGVYALAYERYAQESDRKRARQLLSRLAAEYPASSLIARTGEIARLLETKAVPAARRAASKPPAAAPAAARPTMPVVPPSKATLVGVRRAELGSVVRITLEIDSETTYREERLDNPARVFFDLKNVRLGNGLSESALNFEGDVVRQVRIGRRGEATARIAMDLDGVSRYSVFTLYNPYRLVVDFERARAAGAPAATPPAVAAVSTAGSSTSSEPAPPSPKPAPPPEKPLPSTPARGTMTAAPGVPAANRTGSYSLARQLGLGVARIVIDAGHGGHDPGALGHRITEAELVLDVALRLEQLLQKERGIEVVMTRRSDVFIPLEERTAIANRAGADLFLSIHANASHNAAARGVETYYLNFASNPEAEAVAARENSASGRTLNALPEILRAIALNDKLDESRDLAELVQRSMARRLRTHNANLKNLGVKRAPFVVLIGAGMPSVLAEISFVTNKQEAALLRTGAYRQRIAQALVDAVTQYQRSLKKVTAVADSSAR
jgi:N-acetylmuramoyl-L-alanine amidase